MSLGLPWWLTRTGFCSKKGYLKGFESGDSNSFPSKTTSLSATPTNRSFAPGGTGVNRRTLWLSCVPRQAIWAPCPYDLLHAGRKLSFNLGDIFPSLSYPVVTVLDRGDLDALYDAQGRHAPGQLGDNATKEFVLRHVFEIAPELIKQPSDLLRVLLRRHYSGQRIPAMLEQRLVQLLRQSNAFNDWPIETLLQDREAFFAFLQERWPIFLNHMAANGDHSTQEDKVPSNLTIEGPIRLPFDHHDIRVYIDNLFLEGLLQPVPHENADTLSKAWVNLAFEAPHLRTDPATWPSSSRISKHPFRPKTLGTGIGSTSPVDGRRSFFCRTSRTQSFPKR